jgi:hypothetical protein
MTAAIGIYELIFHTLQKLAAVNDTYMSFHVQNSHCAFLTLSRSSVSTEAGCRLHISREPSAIDLRHDDAAGYAKARIASRQAIASACTEIIPAAVDNESAAEHAVWTAQRDKSGGHGAFGIAIAVGRYVAKISCVAHRGINIPVADVGGVDWEH